MVGLPFVYEIQLDNSRPTIYPVVFRMYRLTSATIISINETCNSQTMIWLIGKGQLQFERNCLALETLELNIAH